MTTEERSKVSEVPPLPNGSAASEKPAQVQGALKSERRREPASEELPNFSRVTPAQLSYITFNPDARFQPVRPVSTKVIAGGRAKASRAPDAALSMNSDKHVGGGGILILEDTHPGEAVEYLVFETHSPISAPPEAAPAAAPTATELRRLAISLDENAPEADPPQPFEVC
jgi:26S proteasome regulatory subunit N2